MANHALIYLLAFVIPGFIGFFSFGIYTRLLSPAEYAVYSVGASLSFLIGNVVFGWMRFALGRYQSEAPQRNFLPFILSIFLAITAVLLPLGYGLSSFITSVSPFVVFAVLSMTVSQALFDIVQETRRARKQSVGFAVANVSRSILSFTFAVAGAVFLMSGAGLVLGISVGFMTLAMVFLYKNRASLFDPGLSLDETNRFLKYGLPLAMSGLVFSGNSTLARIIVGVGLGADDAGRFGAALDMTSQIAGIVAASISSILAPTAIRANSQHGAKAAQKQLSDGAELFLATMVPATIGLVITANSFGEVITGPAFEQAVQVMLPLLAVSRGLNCYAQFYLHIGFQIVERPLRQVVCGAATLVINIVASSIFLQFYGVQGAVYGLLIGDLAGVVVSYLLLLPIFPMPLPIRSVVRVGLCSLAMVAACVPFDWIITSPVLSLTLTPLVGAIAYAIAAYWLDVAKLRTELLGATVTRLRGMFR